MENENTIELIGKHITENVEEIADGYVAVEFVVDELLGNICSSDIRKYAKEHYDLIPVDDLEDASTDDLVSELQDRDYNFIRGAEPEALIAKLEVIGYKVFDEYDKTYDEFLKLSGLDNIDFHKLNEILRKFMQGSLQERDEMYQTLFR